MKINRAIMKAIVKQAFLDIVNPPALTYHNYKDLDIDETMEFILSDTCEVYCQETGVDYIKLRKQAAEAYRRMFEVQ